MTASIFSKRTNENPINIDCSQTPEAVISTAPWAMILPNTIGDLIIHFLPANHGSGRSLHESDQTLWGGWLFEWNG